MGILHASLYFFNANTKNFTFEMYFSVDLAEAGCLLRVFLVKKLGNEVSFSYLCRLL